MVDTVTEKFLAIGPSLVFTKLIIYLSIVVLILTMMGVMVNVGVGQVLVWWLIWLVVRLLRLLSLLLLWLLLLMLMRILISVLRVLTIAVVIIIQIILMGVIRSIVSSGRGLLLSRRRCRGMVLLVIRTIWRTTITGRIKRISTAVRISRGCLR